MQLTRIKANEANAPLEVQVSGDVGFRVVVDDLWGQDGMGNTSQKKKQAFELSLETCRVCRGEEGFLKN